MGQEVSKQPEWPHDAQKRDPRDFTPRSLDSQIEVASQITPTRRELDLGLPKSDDAEDAATEASAEVKVKSNKFDKYYHQRPRCIYVRPMRVDIRG